jgi:DNA-binding CsgD family transcriptional regulator
MRQWQARAASGGTSSAIGGMVRALAQDDFQARVLEELHPVLPAASWSVYRTGAQCRPTLFMSASRGIPDRTRDCWWAYLSGPYRQDRSFGPRSAAMPRLCHVTAQEIPGEHRIRVYEAHGVRERISVVEHDGDTVFAVNLYRHEHQRPFTDAQIAAFEGVALPLLELARKHILLTGGAPRAAPPRPAEVRAPTPTALGAGALRERLLALDAALTPRELDVCVRLAQGMTHDGIAADLGLGLTTVKTYRNRAFARLGIHFRNELFARVLGA